MGRHRNVSLALVAPAAILCLAACDDGGAKPDPAADGADRAALMRLYSVTYGPGWTRSDGWGGDAPLETWYGVETDGSGRVVGLDLGGVWDADIGGWISQGLIGPIPPELAELAHLETLALGRNTLKGPVPPRARQPVAPDAAGPGVQQPDRPDTARARRPHPAGRAQPAVQRPLR